MSKRTLTLKLVAAALATLPLLAQATPYTGITHDGWQQINGELIRFVGVPGADSKAAAATPRLSGAAAPQAAHQGALGHFGTAPAAASADQALAAKPDHMPAVFDANRKVGDIVFGARS